MKFFVKIVQRFVYTVGGFHAKRWTKFFIVDFVYFQKNILNDLK